MEWLRRDHGDGSIWYTSKQGYQTEPSPWSPVTRLRVLEIREREGDGAPVPERWLRVI